MDAEHYINTAHLQKDHWWYEARRRIFADIIARLGLSQDTKILEAGCGPGANLEMLGQFGEVSGFDPDEFAAKYAADVSNLPVQRGDLPVNCPFDGPFDLVCAFDVIEHIDDDKDAVSKLCEVTAGGGYALFSVPAYQWLWSKHDEINHHKRRYTAKHFKQVLQEGGYEVQSISYINMWLFPLAAIVRFLKKLTGKDDQTDVTLPSPAMNALLTKIFASERYLLRALPLPFGLSIVALCKKTKGRP